MKTQRTMRASEVRDKWSEAVDTVASDEARIRIERSGTPVAGLVSARDLEWLALRDRRLEELRAVVSQMREAFADIPEDEIEQEIAQALAEVRTETQRERDR
jgi:prevent-host-death family protein